MIRSVVVNVIAAQIAQPVHIESGVVMVQPKAICDVPALDHLIAAVPSIPEAQVRNKKDGFGELDVQIHSLIVQIAVVDLQHLLVAFVLGEVREFLLHILPPVLIVDVVVAPDQVITIVHRLLPSLRAWRTTGLKW